MHTIIKLEIEDIVTRPCGANISITPPLESLWIILTPEAAQELVDDILTILPMLPTVEDLDEQAKRIGETNGQLDQCQG